MTEMIGYLYAGVVAVGGCVGYIKAGSTMSLVSGLGFGSLLTYAANRVNRNPKDVYPSLVLSTILLIVMGIRFNKSGKFMPAGLVACLSFLMVALYGYRLLN